MDGVIVVEDDVRKLFDKISSDVQELKNMQLEIVKVFSKQNELDNLINYQTERADEARKVIHKRIDRLEADVERVEGTIYKVIFGVITALVGVVTTVFMEKL